MRRLLSFLNVGDNKNQTDPLPRRDSYSALGEYINAVKDYSVAIEILTKALHGTGVTSSDTFDYYSKRSKAYERLGKRQLSKKDFRTGVKLTYVEKTWAEYFFKQGQELEDTEKFMKGVEDRELKELKIERYKIAAILGHKKAQAWLKKKRIEWEWQGIKLLRGSHIEICKEQATSANAVIQRH
jgi:tetratricopeptide (TPR) repeat protein